MLTYLKGVYVRPPKKFRSDFGAVWKIMKYLDKCYRTHFTSIVKRKKIQGRFMYSGMLRRVDWSSMTASCFGVVGVVTTVWAGRSRIWFSAGTREFSCLSCRRHILLDAPSLLWNGRLETFRGACWLLCLKSSRLPSGRAQRLLWFSLPVLRNISEGLNGQQHLWFI
jgi:hypothetical protein